MEKQYVIFKLGNEEYGIDIMYIKEIIRFQKITTLPHSSESVEGIINYRGKIVPILNIKKKFGLGSEVTTDNDTRIIVVNIGTDQLGILVDEASQTVKIDDSNVEKAPEVFSSTVVINKIGKIDDRLISLVDIEHLVNKDELRTE